MRATADGKRKRCAALAAIVGLMLFASAGTGHAQGMDATDRQDKMDINREDANSTIGRIRHDRHEQRDKTMNKSGTSKKRLQRLQY